MKPIWANRKLVQSWDRAVIAAGGVVVAVLMAVVVAWGDPAAEDIDMEALERVEQQLRCTPDPRGVLPPLDYC